MNDELKKLGLRVRPRTVTPASSTPGKIAFDDRGNAVFEWNDRLGLEGEDADRLRSRALEHPGLSLMEDEPLPNAPLQPNPKGLRMGYDPYQSGLLTKKEWRRKRDLRELSKWIEMKRKVHGRPPDED